MYVTSPGVPKLSSYLNLKHILEVAEKSLMKDNKANLCGSNKLCTKYSFKSSQIIMSSSSDTLQFHFPTHGDSVLSRMNALREEHRFCDITLLLGGPRGAAAQPLRFHGHRVVLAASSDFLRDQFLLHEGRAELRVGVVSSVEVGERLLLSCYTGLLEVRCNLLLLCRI